MERERSTKKSKTPGWIWSHAANQVLLFLVVGISSVVLKAKSFSMPPSVFWVACGLLAVVLLLMLYGMLRKSANYVWWEAVLLLMTYGGIWLFALAVFPTWSAVVTAAILTVLPLFLSMTWSNNLPMAVGTAGVGLLLAVYFPFSVMLVSSVGVAAYEYYRSRGADLATLFSEAWHAGVVPGFLVPSDVRGWMGNVGRVWQPGQGVVAGFLPFVSAAAMGYVAASRGYAPFVLYAVSTLLMSAFFGRSEHGAVRWWVFPLSSSISFAAMGLGYALV